MKRGWMTSKTVLFRARMLSNFGKTTEADQTCLRSVSIAAADRLISIVQKRRQVKKFCDTPESFSMGLGA